MQQNARESTENMNSKILTKGSHIFTIQHFHLKEAEFLEYLLSTLGGERVKRKNYLFPSSFLLWYRNNFIKTFIFRKYHKLILTAAELSPQRATPCCHQQTPNTPPQKPNLAVRKQSIFHFHINDDKLQQRTDTVPPTNRQKGSESLPMKCHL